MATIRFDNPFHDLWVTEILDPNAFVRIFSAALVKDTEALFSTGNIILKGRQGCGKSMLLNLLDTSTRFAYAQTEIDYPVPKKQRNFISSGVQLSQQSASLIAARAYDYPIDKRDQILASYFADYLNTLLCLDLLKNISKIYEFQDEYQESSLGVRIDLSSKTEKRL